MGGNIEEEFVIESEKILEIAVKAADDKRAEDIVGLDVRGISVLADYFVICHGNSDKQVLAIANEVVDKMAEHHVEIKRVEGKDSARWILVDLGDVIVHVFHAEEREFYNLEKLWSDAPLVNLTALVE